MLEKAKWRFLRWLAPGVLAEVDRLRWLTEAMHDLHVLDLPYTPAVEEAAWQNAKAFEPRLVAGEATMQDRQRSLLEVLKRSGAIR